MVLIFVGIALWVLIIAVGAVLAHRAGTNYEIEDSDRRSYAVRNVESEAASSGGVPGLHPTRREPR